MYAILIVSHADLAPALARAAQTIAGPQAGVAALTLGEDESPAALAERLRDAVAALGSEIAGALFLADLTGGAPYQAARAAARALSLPRGCAVVGGANLGMVVEALLEREAATSADELAARVVAHGREHIGAPRSLGSLGAA